MNTSLALVALIICIKIETKVGRMKQNQITCTKELLKLFTKRYRCKTWEMGFERVPKYIGIIKCMQEFPSYLILDEYVGKGTVQTV